MSNLVYLVLKCRAKYILKVEHCPSCKIDQIPTSKIDQSVLSRYARSCNKLTIKAFLEKIYSFWKPWLFCNSWQQLTIKVPKKQCDVTGKIVLVTKVKGYSSIQNKCE